MTNTQLSKCFTQEPAETYHAKAVDFLGSHRLADFRRCPLLYHWKQTGLTKDEDRPAYQIGRAAHTLILEGRQKFLAEYAIGGPINEKTGQPFGTTTKAFAEWAAAQGKPEAVQDKIAEGKLKDYYTQFCLLEQPFVRDQKLTVGQLVQERIALLKENIVVRRFARFKVGEEAASRAGGEGDAPSPAAE